MDAPVVPAAVERMLAPKCVHRPGWLEELPALVCSYARRWRLDLAGAEVESGHNTCIVACADARGEQVVLKLAPDVRRPRHEGQALSLWQAAGTERSVRLLRVDPFGGALLLERVLPGNHLRADPEAIPLVASALEEIHRPSGRHARGLASLVRAARAKWRNQQPAFGRLVAAGLVSWPDLDWIESRMEELLATAPSEAVVLHADLHESNVLVCRRRGAVLIDPRPYVGERAYDVATWLSKQRDPAGIEEAGEEFADLLALSARRILSWARVKALRTASIAHCTDGSEEQVEALVRFAVHGRVRAARTRALAARAAEARR